MYIHVHARVCVIRWKVFFISTKLMEKKIGKHAVRRCETCFPVYRRW